MTVHRFSVNVPNPGPDAAIARLSLESAKRAALRSLALRIPEAPLKVVSAGLSLDPCDTKGKKSLRLSLKPYSSVDVQVVVVTAPAASGKPAMAAFHVVDKRAGRPPGGVTVVCTFGAGPEPVGTTIAAQNPCPVALAAAAYPVKRDADPSKPPASKIIPLGADVDLVVPITNPTRTALTGVQVYLEHLGRCDAQFSPVTWNVGTMAPGQVFYATWPLVASGWMSGKFQACVVAGCQRKDSVRLAAPIRTGKERDVVGRGRGG